MFTFLVMDPDFWKMRLAAAKRQFNLQNQQHLSRNHTSQFDRFRMEDFEVEEEIRPDFSCPYCSEEFDIASLCLHLEADHPYESKSTEVCPVCSVKVVSDMLSHITVQHGHLFKVQQRRGRLRRVPFPNSQSLSVLGRDLREAHLQVLLGGGGGGGGNGWFRSNTDNLLSSLVSNFPASESDDISKSLMSSLEEKSPVSRNMWKSSFQSSLSREEQEERRKQAAGRAVFVQDLLVSTLLTD